MNISVDLNSQNEMQPTNSPYGSEVESVHNDFHSIKCNICSGFYFNFSPEVDWLV